MKTRIILFLAGRRINKLTEEATESVVSFCHEVATENGCANYAQYKARKKGVA